MAASERFLVDAEQRNMAFVVNLFQKQLQRLNTQLEQFIVRSPIRLLKFALTDASISRRVPSFERLRAQSSQSKSARV